jgi:glycosyltransferase involved in cell wall biosynthesis
VRATDARALSMSTILVLAPYVPHPPRHGGSIRSRVLLQALASDHDVHVAAAVTDEWERAALADLGGELRLTVHEVPARSPRRSSAARKFGFWARGLSELLHRRWDAGARDAVERLLRERAFDLVVADSTFVLPLLQVRRPEVLFLHNLEHALLGRTDDTARSASDRLTRSIEARRIRGVEATAIDAAELTITVSDHDRELAESIAPRGRVVAVPNTVDLRSLPLQPPAPDGPPRLLFVGKLDYPPNLEAVRELIERHLPALRAAFPGLLLRLVGSDAGGHGQRFASVPGVEVVGPVADLLPHYRESHAAYLPIRSGGGTRVKILEAWALGLPVLSTAVGAEGLLGEDRVHLRRFETVDEGTAALREVLAGEGRRMVPEARELVERHYSHAAAITRLREVISALRPARR